MAHQGSSAARRQFAKPGQAKSHTFAPEMLEQRMLLSAAVQAVSPASEYVWEPDIGHISYPRPLYYSSRNWIEAIAGTDGDLWLLPPGADHLSHRLLDGTVSDVPISAGADGKPRQAGDDILLGPGAQPWFTIRGGEGWQIARMNSDGQVTEMSLPQLTAIGEMTLGGDGFIWYAQGNHVGRVGLDGATQVISLTGVSWVDAIATAADGSVWFAAQPVADGMPHTHPMHMIGQVGTVGIQTQFQFETATWGNITDLQSGPDAKLYFTTSGAVYRVDLAGQREDLGNLAGATGLTEALGSMWLVDQSNALNPLVRIDAAGHLLHFSAPSPGVLIDDLTTAPDGSVWIVESEPQKFEQLQTADLLAQGTRLNVDHKTEFTRVIGSFADSVGTGDAGQYSALIDWGNGQSSPGQVVANDAGGFDVIGTAALRWGWNAIKVTVTCGDGRSTIIHSAAYATLPPIAGKGTLIKPTAGRNFAGTVASFVGLDIESLGEYGATIYWGDGQSSAGQLIGRPSGTVRVIGTHIYAAEGLYNIQVYINEPGNRTLPWQAVPRPNYNNVQWGAWGAPISFVDSSWNPSSFNDVRSRAVVAPAAVDGDILTIDATTGLPFHGEIASFTCADPADDASHYRAEIEWDDGQITHGVIQSYDPGSFDVVTRHVFLDTYSSVTVRIYDDRLPDGDNIVGLVRDEVDIESHLWAEVVPFTAIGGQEFSGVVGHIQSLGAGTLWSSAFTIDIDWGDGTSSKGTAIDQGEGEFDILGTHTFAASSRHRSTQIYIDISEQRTPLADSLPTPPTPYFADTRTDYYESDPILVAGIEGLNLLPADRSSSPTAMSSAWMDAGVLVPAVPEVMPGDFAGTVFWDDGGQSTVTLNGDGDGNFYMRTAYTFQAAGPHTGMIVISGSGVTRTMPFNVAVSEPAPPPTPVLNLGWIATEDISALEREPFSGIVGTFTPGDANPIIEQLAVTIYWGDGSSAGILEAAEDGSYTITGSHIFKTGGGRWFDIQINDGTRTVYGKGEVEVAYNSEVIHAEAESTLSFRQREEFTSKVAHFFAPDAAKIEDFQVTIDWGDGTTSAGEVTTRYRGGFDVSGTHTYSIYGYHQIHVTITGPGGTDTATTSIQLAREPVLVTPTSPVVTPSGDGTPPQPEYPTIKGMTVAGKMATFVDEDGESTNPDSYRVYHAALIDWGDGQITWGAVSRNAQGGYDVVSSHTYDAAGDYTIKLVVRRNTRYLPALPTRSHPRVFSGEFFEVGPTSAASVKLIAAAPSATDEFAKVLYRVHIRRPAANPSAHGGAHHPSPKPPKPAPRPEAIMRSTR